MPSYDFRCDKCGDVITVQRSIADRTSPPKSCKECRGRKFTRIYTPTAFRFVGGLPSHGN